MHGESTCEHVYRVTRLGNPRGTRGIGYNHANSSGNTRTVEYKYIETPKPIFTHSWTDTQRHRRATMAAMVSIPPRAPSVPTTAQCVNGSNGCLTSTRLTTVAPRKEYSVMPVMNAAIAHARNTNGNEKMTLLRWRRE